MVKKHIHSEAYQGKRNDAIYVSIFMGICCFCLVAMILSKNRFIMHGGLWIYKMGTITFAALSCVTGVLFITTVISAIAVRIRENNNIEEE